MIHTIMNLRNPKMLIENLCQIPRKWFKPRAFLKCLMLKVTAGSLMKQRAGFISKYGNTLTGTYLVDFNPRNFQFLVGFSFETPFPMSSSVMTLVSKDVESSCASFDLCEKFARGCPHSNAYAKVKNWIFPYSVPRK